MIKNEQPENTFLADPRYKQSLIGIPYHDAILAETLGAYHIKRTRDHNDPERYLRALELDKIHGIDLTCMTQKHQLVGVSEKCLSNKFAHHNTITIEHYQDGICHRGDYFKILAEFYLVSYLNYDGNGLCKWALLNMPALKVADYQELIPWRETINAERGRATLRYVDLKIINDRCPHVIVAQEGFL